MRNVEKIEYEVRDSVRGVVMGGSSKGLFLLLENEESAFAAFGTLPYGTEVVCTLLRKAVGRRLAEVSIDAVVGNELMVA